MSMKELKQEQLEKVTGGADEWNQLDTSFTHLITADELLTLAKDTEILISYSGTSQCIGPFKKYEYMVPGVKNSLFVEFRVTKATPDLQSWVGVKATAGAQFNTVRVYRK